MDQLNRLVSPAPPPKQPKAYVVPIDRMKELEADIEGFDPMMIEDEESEDDFGDSITWGSTD